MVGIASLGTIPTPTGTISNNLAVHAVTAHHINISSETQTEFLFKFKVPSVPMMAHFSGERMVEGQPNGKGSSGVNQM